MKEFGWEFSDRELLATACSGEGTDFERLELLGDAVADAILLPWLYCWSTGTVAVLAGARQQLTCDTNLDHLSVLTGLHGVLPPPKRDSPGQRADLVEAVIGAAFVDGSWPAARAVSESIFGAWLVEPVGVAEGSARIDTAVTHEDGEWHWRCLVWTSGAPEPCAETGTGPDPVLAEVQAIVAGLLHLGREFASVWVEVTDELRTEMLAGPASDHSAAIRELRALLAAFDGVWFVPSDRLDTTLDPWSGALMADGIMTEFETTVGHDLLRPALERLALHPGQEQRRLAFVGAGVLKSASAIRAFTEHPDRHVGHLHDAVHNELALDQLHRAAFAAGLVDLLFPGARPADAVSLIRAALGATAVDAGPDHAVALATQWLDNVRVNEADVDHLCVIHCHIGGMHGGRRHVEVDLLTPGSEASWRFEDDGIDHHALAIEALCVALDCIEPEYERQPVLIGAPAGVVAAVDGTNGLRSREEIATAIGRFLARIDQRGLRVLWHGPVQGTLRTPVR